MPGDPTSFADSSAPFDISKFLAAAGLGVATGLPQGGTQNQQTQQTTQQSGMSTTQQFIDALTKAFTENKGSSTQTSSPNLTPGLQGLMDQLTSKFGQLANPNTKNIEASGIQKINNNSNAQSEVVNNIMASRGLATSPVAATAEGNVQNQRFGQINDFQRDLPQLIQSLNLQGAGAASGFLNSAPVGSTITGATSNTGTSQSSNQQSTQGNQVTNQNQNSTGSTTGQTSTGGGVGGALGGLAAFLAKLFG